MSPPPPPPIEVTAVKEVPAAEAIELSTPDVPSVVYELPEPAPPPPTVTVIEDPDSIEDKLEDK